MVYQKPKWALDWSIEYTKDARYSGTMAPLSPSTMLPGEPCRLNDIVLRFLIFLNFVIQSFYAFAHWTRNNVSSVKCLHRLLSSRIDTTYPSWSCLQRTWILNCCYRSATQRIVYSSESFFWRFKFPHTQTRTQWEKRYTDMVRWKVRCWSLLVGWNRNSHRVAVNYVNSKLKIRHTSIRICIGNAMISCCRLLDYRSSNSGHDSSKGHSQPSTSSFHKSIRVWFNCCCICFNVSASPHILFPIHLPVIGSKKFEFTGRYASLKHMWWKWSRPE